MIACTILLATTGSLLDSNSWPAKGRQGSTAEPDYKTIVGRLTESVHIEDILLAPTVVVTKAETGLRVMRGAFKSAPNYMAHAASVLSAANSELASLGGGLREASLPAAEQVVQTAEGGLRQLRAAYNSAPDYAKIASGVLTSAADAAAGVLSSSADDEELEDVSVGFDCFGFALQAPDVVRTAGNVLMRAAEGPSLWKEASESASPNYGAIAMAAALDGLKDKDPEDSMTGWF